MSKGLIKVEDYAIVKGDVESSVMVIQQNAGPQGITVHDLTRMKIPTGGGIAWEVPTLEGVESAQTIEGVIIHFQDARRFWSKSFDEAPNQPPDCVSEDGFKGIGTPGGSCATCPKAQFGSAVKDGKQSRGQACSAVRYLFMIREEGLLPCVVVLPPTSLKAGRQFFLNLGQHGIPFFAVRVALTLEKDKNADGVTYSKVVFKKVGDVLTGETLKKIKAIRDGLMPYISSIQLDDTDFRAGDDATEVEARDVTDEEADEALDAATDEASE